eukprot:GHVO01023148.1.p1 GENE.GHVO01023148.1~~GHVO01023148.1.p1  ORF type:complete len:177 (+),score=22.31 GHVO01023148.1:59-589(+)
MRLISVGYNMKHPLLPIWVVGTGSHYSLLFSLDARVAYIPEKRRLAEDWARMFDDIDVEMRGYVEANQIQAMLENRGVNRAKAYNFVDDIPKIFDDYVSREAYRKELFREFAGTSDWKSPDVFAVYIYDGQSPKPELTRFVVSKQPAHTAVDISSVNQTLQLVAQTLWEDCFIQQA